MSLTITNITKTYGSRPVFKPVSLEIHSGQMIAVRGRSGSGKSTLLNMIAGLETASEGEIRLEGISYKGRGLDQLSQIRKDNIGYISQHNPMIPKMTARDNIMVPLWFHKKGHSRQHFYAIIQEWAQLLQVEPLLDQRIEKLSGGELQRIGVMRALLKSPKLLVADEPTASLDDETADLVVHCLQQVSSQGTMVILATHHAATSSKCDFIYQLSQDGMTPLI